MFFFKFFKFIYFNTTNVTKMSWMLSGLNENCDIITLDNHLMEELKII